MISAQQHPSGALQIRFPQPGDLLSMNDRSHWAKKAREARLWRETAGWAALTGRFGQIGPCRVVVTLPVVDRRRRDPHNYAPTVKAVVDGLVDAKLWPDDTPEWVSVSEPVLEVRKKPHNFVDVTLFPRE